MLQKLKTDRIAAMKAKDTVAKNILSFLLSEAQNVAKAETREVTDSDVTKAAQTVIKKNQQTLDAMSDNDERTSVIQNEIKILEGFLPDQYTELQLKSIIDVLVTQIPSAQRGKKMMGRLMGQLNEHGDAVDKRVASKYIQEVIAKIEADKAKIEAEA